MADENGRFDLCYVIDGSYKAVIEDPKGQSVLTLENLVAQSAQALEGAFKFRSVPEMLAGDVLSYSAGVGRLRVQAAELVSVSDGSFMYEIAEPNVTDHHLTTSGGVKLYAVRQHGVFDFRQFGAVGDYYLNDGSVNPNPTDDTTAIQACIDATGGNGSIVCSSMHYTTAPLLNAGILSICSGQAPSLYNKAHQGKLRPYGLVNTTSDMFDTDPVNAQSAFHFQGLSLKGDAGTTLFSVLGKTPIGDYFNVHLNGCKVGGFGIGIDGSLGSWLWKIENCDIGNSHLGYMDTAICLYQPHGVVIEKNGFGYRNRQDILSTSGGVSATFRNNAFDFKLDYKEIGLELINPQSWLIEGNYSEQYAGSPAVNDGDGTYPIIMRLSHYTDHNVPVIRNNYFAAPGVQRLITIGRQAGDEAFYSKGSLEIYENTVNGLAGDYIYHDHDAEYAGKTLTMPKPRINIADATYTIGDPNGTLRFYGNGTMLQARATYVSPAHNTIVKLTDPAVATIFKFDNCADLDADGRIRVGVVTPGTFTVSWRWDAATAADFKMRVYDSSGAPNLGDHASHETGTYGSGSVIIPTEAGNLSYFYIKAENTSGSGTVCDNLQVSVRFESLSP